MNQQIDKQSVLGVLNSLEVIERQGGEDAYALVEINEENCTKLAAVGISRDRLVYYGDENTFCIYALAFGDRYADEVRNWKLIAWNPLVDDDLRYRVLNGEGDAMDAERLLRALEPNLFE